VAILLGISVFYHLPVPKREFVNDAVQYLIEKQGIPTKIKIVIGFYQIATRVETVYGITLPEAVRKMMMLLRIAISFGIDGIPLACVGADGYHARLVFWTVVPLVVVFVVTCIGAAYALRRTLPCFRAASQSESKEPAKPKGKGQMGELGELILNATLPAILRITFLAYPIVTNVAFEAFPCFDFEEGESFLIADVEIVCYTHEHRRVRALAVLAIFLYPIGLFVLNSLLLLASRKAIIDQGSSILSRATSFLHREYKATPSTFFWELMEMGRRVLLVGAYVTGPFHPGSMLQLALALVTCLVHLSIQQQLWPWKNFADNYLALGCNLSLVTLFTASIFFKFAILTEIKDIQDAMSHELREDYVLDGQKSVFLTFMIVMSIAGALILLAIIVTVQSGQHARELEQKRRANRILKDQGSLVRQGLRLEVEALNDKRRRQQLTSALETMEQSSDALSLEAANGVFNASGLHPIYWGISKGQLITFREEVKEALKRGDITNPFGSDPDHPFHYAP